MPVLLITDSTLVKVLSCDTSLVHFGDNTVIHNSRASLSFAGPEAAFPATLLSLWFMHTATLLKKYGDMQMDIIAVQISGSIAPSKTSKKNDALALLRRAAGLKEFPWQFADVHSLLRKQPQRDEVAAEALKGCFRRLCNHKDGWRGLWNKASSYHVRRCLCEALLPDMLDMVGPSSCLRLLVCAGCNAQDLEAEVKAHEVMASSSSLGALQSSMCLAYSEVVIHPDWLPLLRLAVLSHPQVNRASSSNTIFILTVDPFGLGAEAADAWKAVGFKPRLVCGQLPYEVPLRAVSAAHHGWQMRFIPEVYEATVQWGLQAYIFIAEDSARPVHGLHWEQLQSLMLSWPPAEGYWLGFRKYRKSKCDWQHGRLLPGGRLDGCLVKHVPGPIGSKFFAVTRRCLRLMHAAGLQAPPWGCRDHLNSCLVASGLVHFVTPSLTTSVAHCSNQLGGRLVDSDDATVMQNTTKLPTWQPLPPELWREAEEHFSTGTSYRLEPLLRYATVMEDSVAFSYGSGNEVWELDMSTGNIALSQSKKATPITDESTTAVTGPDSFQGRPRAGLILMCRKAAREVLAAAAVVSEESQHRLRSPVNKRPRLQSSVHKSRVKVSNEAQGVVKSTVFQDDKAPVVEIWKRGRG